MITSCYIVAQKLMVCQPRIPGEGNGNPFQYSCLGNPMDREPWQATAQGVAKSWTRLSTHRQTSPTRL